jgi:hypothetical protein
MFAYVRLCPPDWEFFWPADNLEVGTARCADRTPPRGVKVTHHQNVAPAGSFAAEIFISLAVLAFHSGAVSWIIKGTA